MFGYVHHGIHTAARHLKKALRETLRKEITETGYALRVVGHSLGAGTAVVLTSMLRRVLAALCAWPWLPCLPQLCAWPWLLYMCARPCLPLQLHACTLWLL